MPQAKPRIKKSVSLTKEEKIAFEKWVKKQGTKTDAIEILEVHIGTLDRVLSKGSCSEDTKKKIDKILNN